MGFNNYRQDKHHGFWSFPTFFEYYFGNNFLELRIFIFSKFVTWHHLFDK